MKSLSLLSIDEANQYSSSDDARIAKLNGEADWWWLRSPGVFSKYAAFVNDIGDVYSIANNVYDDYFGVRPALWINLES